MAMRDYEGLVKNLRKMQSVNYCAIASAEGFPAIRIVQDAADAIEELTTECRQLRDATKLMPKWISVEDALPSEWEPVYAAVRSEGREEWVIEVEAYDQDLKKAKWYLDRLIERKEQEGNAEKRLSSPTAGSV